ncbi:MAG TPA: cell division protein FtsQ [Sphingobacteriaceae bacterium]
MLKRINWKGILYGFLWTVCLASVVVLMSFIEVKKASVTCKDVRIIIPGNQNFVERSEIDNILLTAAGPLVGKPLNQINIHQLETALKANPFIEFAKVYGDMNGVIHVKVKQREPVLRIFNIADQDFYIDRNGMKIPTAASFTANVLAANGQITESFNNTVDTLRSKLAKDLFSTALYIERDTLWRDQIEQIYVNNEREIELVPRVGNHKIILGTADSLESKFLNLLMFYKKALPVAGWDAYKTINLKYANQIVCVKNAETENAGANTVKVATKPVKTDSATIKLTTQDTVKN